MSHLGNKIRNNSHYLVYGLILQLKGNQLSYFYQKYLTMNCQDPLGQEQFIDEFRILYQLGSGYQAIVYLAVDLDGNKVAIKKFKKLPSMLSSLQEELVAMEQLHHQNLIKLISIRQNAIFKSKQKIWTNCFAIVLEYAGGGELFDFVADTGKFSEKVTRTYFHQMMNGIHYMHEKGYAHRDIKPQNLLLSDTFVLKIADFGFTYLLKGRDGSGILKTKLGTEGYMAPQIFCKEYDGRKIDIFAAGVILFIMYTGTPPFEKAAATDPYYKLIKQKKMGIFWESHSKKKPYGFFSDSFKDLFDKMIAKDPAQRPTILQIAKHLWVKGTICTHSEIKKEFTERRQRLVYVLDDRRKVCQQEGKILSESISSELESYRGDQVDHQLVEKYCKLKLLKHTWPQAQQEPGQILVKNHDTQFVVCMLREYLCKLEFDLQLKTPEEEDLIESECQSFVMKAQEVTFQGETLKATFIYTTTLKKREFPHRIIANFQFSKNKHSKTMISMQPQEEHFYRRLITRNITAFFS